MVYGTRLVGTKLRCVVPFLFFSTLNKPSCFCGCRREYGWNEELLELYLPSMPFICCSGIFSEGPKVSSKSNTQVTPVVQVQGWPQLHRWAAPRIDTFPWRQAIMLSMQVTDDDAVHAGREQLLGWSSSLHTTGFCTMLTNPESGSLLLNSSENLCLHPWISFHIWLLLSFNQLISFAFSSFL